MSGFWLEEEPTEFPGFKEIADQLNAPGATLPMTMIICAYGEEQKITFVAIERDHMDGGDFLVDCRLGEEERQIRIWWNEEAGAAHVEDNTSLDETLNGFAEQWDVLPPVNREGKGVDAYELSELKYGPAHDLGSLLVCGDPGDELAHHVVIYGDGKADCLLRDHFDGRVDRLLCHDANGDALTKFVLPLMNSTELYDLLSGLRRVNAEAELTFDITIIWGEDQIQAA